MEMWKVMGIKNKSKSSIDKHKNLTIAWTSLEKKIESGFENRSLNNL